jgi:ABC transporter substrate binding protein (PQQ-dependent alcohol dehydrogenase system)
VRGFRSQDNRETVTPSPRPSPLRGEGVHRAYVESSAQLTASGRAGLRAVLVALSAVTGAAVASAQTPQPPAPPPPAQQQRITIGFVEIDGDPRHEPIKAYERLVLRTRDHPFAGAQVGIDEAAALTRVLKIDFALERITVKSDAEVAPAVTKAMAERNIQFFIVDAPAAAFKPLAAAVKGKDALLFNATAPEDFLRREVCAREIVHTLPSLAMSMDGLTQFLVSRKWRDYLVLQGPAPADAVMVKAFENSVKKFGARISAKKDFKPGTDPRDRDKNNPALITAGTRDYDALFIADDAFDFARQVPYETVRARPVVGAIDLEPVAWHWTWEHNGAPQVNGRFQRLTNGRRMESADFAAWIAVKIVVQSALRTRSADFQKQRQFIFTNGTIFDGDKGLALSIRPWDQQLRQAILLAAPYQVVASAPLEGFFHKTNVLDTLGDDEPETPCKLNK